MLWHMNVFKSVISSDLICQGTAGNEGSNTQEAYFHTFSSLLTGFIFLKNSSVIATLLWHLMFVCRSWNEIIAVSLSPTAITPCRDLRGYFSAIQGLPAPADTYLGITNILERLDMRIIKNCFPWVKDMANNILSLPGWTFLSDELTPTCIFPPPAAC